VAGDLQALDATKLNSIVLLELGEKQVGELEAMAKRENADAATIKAFAGKERSDTGCSAPRQEAWLSSAHQRS
jgi:hypothetical protein